MARCQVCRVSLTNTKRRGSMFDDVCNRAINPKEGPREGSYDERQRLLAELHERLRQGRPGWGQYGLYDLAAMSRRPPADDLVYPDFGRGGMGARRGRR